MITTPGTLEPLASSTRHSVPTICLVADEANAARVSGHYTLRSKEGIYGC
jgi:hypothetical protein